MTDQFVLMLSQDSFYRGLTPEEMEDVKSYNFDHPDAFDQDALLQCLLDLKEGKAVDVPIYDFTTHQRAAETQRVEPADIVILEGILVLHMETIRNMLNMKVYVDTDDDMRLARRIQRDVAHRGRDVDGVIEQYTRFVKPAFDQFVAPSRRYADVIIPWQRGDNFVAIDLITQHIRLKLTQHHLRRIYPNLEVIPSNYQIRGMHTIIRDQGTAKNDFVFYADRLNRLVVEAGLGHLPFREKTVVTPTSAVYVGVDFARRLCGVSIIRSGESMENALRACCQGIKIGKILVHRRPRASVNLDKANGEGNKDGGGGGGSVTGPTDPRSLASLHFNNASSRSVGEDLIYEKLPADIADRHVLLMDPILSTGNTASRAIQVLLERGVHEDKILFLSVIAAPEGIHKLCGGFPALKVITSEIDDRIDDCCCVVPGMGEFADRYFCE